MRSILLVEDDPYIVTLLTQALEKAGFKVFWCDRMDTGLALIREHPIDLIITDFHIQQGSGRRLLGTVRKTNATIPVFLITGTPFVNEEDFAVYNFDKVFLKPFSCRTLVSEVKKAVASSNQYPA